MGIARPRSPRAALWAVSALVLFAPPAVGADADDSSRCRMIAMGAAGRMARSTLGCHVRAVRLGRTVEPNCLRLAALNFSRPFRQLERTGCVAPGDEDALARQVDDFVADVTQTLPLAAGGNRCVATKLAATGKKAADMLRARARLKRRANFFRLGHATGRANAAFLNAFAAAEARGGCGVRGNAPVVGGKVDRLITGVLCGDGARDLGEECDGEDDAVCPGTCQLDCTCGGTVRFACLSGDGPLLNVNGTLTTDYRDKDLASGTRVDAREAVFLASPTNRYPINLGGGLDLCLAGGTVFGQYERTLSWQTMHDMNNAGVAFDSPALTIDGVRVDNVTDGIRPAGEGFTIRAAWLSYVRDDCVENDHLHGGLIDDSLFDGCYVGISERPVDGNLVDDGRGALLTVRRSLIRLEAMPGPRGGTQAERGLGRFFKWDERASQLALHDNVFLAERVGQDGARAMGVPEALVSCSNNVMVWLGGGAYPTTLPSCFTLTSNRSVWDDAVREWKARHPHVGPP